jgi:iron complex outermembrane recepter protein
MKTPRNSAYPIVLALSLIASSLCAQTTAPVESTPPEKPKQAEETLVLSPFVVTTDKDLGYLAGNTLSGSRLNTKLYDTSASISEMTKEFLEDIGATDTMSAVEYSLGFSDDKFGSSGGDNDNRSQFQSQSVVARGISGGRAVARDFFTWNLSSDVFSTERISLSRGPNSILYGVGNAGGIINTMSKRANFGKLTEVNLRTDDSGSMRFHVDHNQRLTDSLALRVNLLQEDIKTWRELEYTRTQRMHLAGTWLPFSRTEIRADYERGIQDRLIGLRFGARDYFQGWLDAGSLPYDRLVNGNTYPTGTASLGTGPRLSYDGDTGQWSNYQRFATSVSRIGGNGTKLANETYAPYSAVLGGRAATSDNSYWTGSVFVQHELLKNLYIELAVNKQADERTTFRTMTHNDIGLRIDPNKTLPGGAINPHYGQFYIEGPALKNRAGNERLNKRASLTYEWDSQKKWLGRHRWLALATEEKTDGSSTQWNEANLTPLNAAIPAYSNAANTIFRRTYLDFNGGNRAYNQDPFRNPQASATFADATNALSGTITPGFYLSSLSPTIDVNGAVMIAGQSNFWNDRLIVTYGWRHDTVERQNTVLVRNPTTQEVTGTTWNPEASFSGNTRTQGAVFNVTPWLAVYGNKSDNFTPQSVLDIDGNQIGNVAGKGKDYGLKFRVGENTLYGRIGYYQSSAVGQSARDFNVMSDIQVIWTALEGTTGPHTSKFTGSPINNSDTNDFDVDGYEFELTANPVKGMALTVNVATLNGVTANLYPIMKAHIEANRAQWAANGTVPVTGNTLTVAGALADIDSRMAQNALQDGREQTRSYPTTVNAFGRYQFQSGALKRWSLGAGTRYRAGRALGFNPAGEPIRAPKLFLVDANLAYRRTIWNKRVDMRLQLNVQNLLDNHDLIWSAINATTFVKNDYTLYTPRTFILSASFSFR